MSHRLNSESSWAPPGPAVVRQPRLALTSDPRQSQAEVLPCVYCRWRRFPALRLSLSLSACSPDASAHISGFSLAASHKIPQQWRLVSRHVRCWLIKVNNDDNGATLGYSWVLKVFLAPLLLLLSPSWHVTLCSFFSTSSSCSVWPNLRFPQYFMRHVFHLCVCVCVGSAKSSRSLHCCLISSLICMFLTEMARQQLCIPS